MAYNETLAKVGLKERVLALYFGALKFNFNLNNTIINGVHLSLLFATK